MVTLEISSTDIKVMEISDGPVTKRDSRPIEPTIIREKI